MSRTIEPKNREVCEKCCGTYATGKEYGDYWYQFPLKDKEPKGLCEFCNPNSKWYVNKNEN